MKMLKTVCVWLLVMVMTASGCSAFAAGMECAAVPLDTAALERYPSFECNEEDGKWCVRTNQADGLLDRFWTYGKANSTPLCVFDIEIEGNVYTGVRTPVLRFYYMDGLDIDATAVSILVGDVRYDLAASSGEVENERHFAEVISAPLGSEAMALIDALMNVETASVRLIGQRSYTFDLDLNTTHSRRRIEAASLNVLASAKQLLDEAGFEAYGLWDMSSAAWEAEYGYAPMYAAANLVKTVGEIAVEDTFGMVEKNDQTRAAKAAQEILIEYGYMSGSATSTFGTNSSAATRRAQHYLGMIETGCMDAQLEKAIREGITSAEKEEFALDCLGEAMVSLDRYWFATGVAPVNSSESRYTVSNGDNVFLIADGWIRNVSAQEMRLFSGIGATVVYDSYSFEASVVCERDAGQALDMTMLPMAQSRLVVFSEVPAWLAREASGNWRIELTADTEKLVYELQ